MSNRNYVERWNLLQLELENGTNQFTRAIRRKFGKFTSDGETKYQAIVGLLFSSVS